METSCSEVSILPRASAPSDLWHSSCLMGEEEEGEEEERYGGLRIWRKIYVNYSENS